MKKRQKSWLFPLFTLVLAGVTISGWSDHQCYATSDSSEALAAQAIATTHFGDGFEYYNTASWIKADGWSNESVFNCGWKADHVSFSNGILTLKLDNVASSGKPYSSGELRTTNKYSYGFYQASMKAAKNIGVVSSFFTYTGPSFGTVWDEIDIEFLGKDTTKVQFNYFKNGKGGHEKIYNLGFDAAASYHTYAFNWQPTYIAWYVDGREVHRATTDIPTTPGYIYMNLWPGITVDSWLGPYNGKTPIYAYYDWVAYQ
jgi:endo-1,3-1,4-beta-glycanase ExoK